MVYPWLKGHGSIKGISPRCEEILRNLYPWLKGHGSIKGGAGRYLCLRLVLRIHG